MGWEKGTERTVRKDFKTYFFLSFFFKFNLKILTRFLRVSFHLQLLKNVGYIPCMVPHVAS